MSFINNILTFHEMNAQRDALTNLYFKAVSENRDFRPYLEKEGSELFAIEIVNNKKSISAIENSTFGHKFKGTVYSIYPELKTFKATNDYIIIGSRFLNVDKSNDVHIYYILDVTRSEIVPLKEFAVMTNAKWITGFSKISCDLPLFENPFKKINNMNIQKIVYAEDFIRRVPIVTSFVKTFEYSKERKDFNAIFRKRHV